MIPNYWWRTHKVLPTVYDESLSYYEVLNKITYHINQIVQSIEDFETDITEDVNEITTLVNQLNTRVDEANTKISATESDITGIKTRLNNDETRLGAAENNINLHGTEISSISVAVAGLDTRLGSAENAITSAKKDITDQEKRITNSEYNINTNAQQINAINTRVTALEEQEYISINCIDCKPDYIVGQTTDYIRVRFMPTNSATWEYTIQDYNNPLQPVRPNSGMIKKETQNRIRIDISGSAVAPFTLTHPIIITIDNKTNKTVSDFSASTFILTTINDSDFDETRSIHEISIHL